MGPSVFSPSFHLRFFPRLLWSLRPRLGAPTPGSLARHALHEHTLLPAAAILVLVTGTSLAGGEHPALGWTLAAAGGAGLVALLVHAVWTRPREAPTWEGFGVTLFALALALAVGGCLIAGLRLPALHLLSLTAASLVAGYIVGLAAGFWVQVLGYMEGPVRFVAGIAVIGVGFVDVLLLLAVWTRL